MPPWSVGITIEGYYCMPIDSISMCSNTYLCLMWMQEAVWGGYQHQPWHNCIILTPQLQVTTYPKIWSKYSGYNYVRLLPYAYGQHINKLQHFEMPKMHAGSSLSCWPQIWYVMTSFWLHMWPRTQESEPSRVDNGLRLLPYANGQHINVLKHFVYV